MSSGIPSMFKTPKHRSFEHKPLIYDAQKERKAELERLVEEHRSGNISEETRREMLRRNLQQRRTPGMGLMRRQESSAQLLRTLVILSALVGLVMLFFNWG